MPGRRPIFVTLVGDIVSFLRDVLFKAILEPASPAKRRAKRMKKKPSKEEQKKED